MITARMRRRLALAVLLAPLTACAVSKHATGPADLGVAHPSGDMLAYLAEPGPIELETVASCDWSVDRKGLINLKHPTARAAGLRKGPEPIQIYFHVLRHPTRGTFLVDTGVETALRDTPRQAALGGAIRGYMKIATTMKFLAPLGEWLTQHPQPLATRARQLAFNIGGAQDVPRPGVQPGHGLAKAFAVVGGLGWGLGPCLCGQGALAYATGQMPRPTQLEDGDYDFVQGLGIEAQYGVGKIAKAPQSAGASATVGTLVDWGMVTGFVSGVANA